MGSLRIAAAVVAATLASCASTYEFGWSPRGVKRKLAKSLYDECGPGAIVEGNVGPLIDEIPTGWFVARGSCVTRGAGR